MVVARQENKIAIINASLEDLEAILEIEHVSFSAPWSRKSFEAELHGNAFSRILAARLEASSEKSGSLVGYVCFWLVFEELRFLNLAVLPTLRRQRVGSQLVARAIELGFSQGSRRGLLEVRESNEGARELYKKFGFLEYAKRKSYYTNPDEDAILMSLDPLTGPASGLSN